MAKVTLLFSGLCVAALAALIYFANSAVTRSAPAYSSWNAGPEGAELLFDGLRDSGLVRVSRELRPLNIEKPSNASVFFLNMKGYSLDSEDEEYFETVEGAAARGDNVVLALNETAVFRFGLKPKKSLLETRWGVHLDKDAVTVSTQWKPLPGLGSGVNDIWQRNFGKGNVTLIAKGQWLSNRSIATDAFSRGLVYQLVSGHPAVIFDESHLGIQESGSVVGLARHYHLQGLMIGFILLAGMFVWSRSVNFPPPPPMAEQTLQGADTRSMLTELMSRYLRKDLMAACIVEWNRTRGSRPAMAMPNETNALAAYVQIQESLEDRAKFRQ